MSSKKPRPVKAVYKPLYAAGFYAYNLPMIRSSARQSCIKSGKESGNALWFILIAVVLLGALTILLSRSGSSVSQTGDVEQARLLAGHVMRYAKGLESAIQQMKMRGVSESDLSFKNDDTAADYTNTGCTVDDCRIFVSGGGGQSYIKPPAGANDSSEWIFTAANNVGTAAYPVGTTASGTGNDIVMLLPAASREMCIQINKDLGIGTAGVIPTDETGIALTPFDGDFPASLVTIDGDATPFELDGHTVGCFADSLGTPVLTDDIIYFYYVLLAR